jgi:thiol-disulfide isomerase/thioredoxin
MKSIFNILLLSSLISIASTLAFGADKNKTLIIFSADWCGACQKYKHDAINSIELSEVIKNYEIVDVDFDVDKDIVSGYNIKTIPAFVVFENTVETGRKIGYKNPRDLIRFLK